MLSAIRIHIFVMNIILFQLLYYVLITHTILFLDVSELCSKVLPEEMKDVEWNVVRTGNPAPIGIANSLIAAGVSHDLGERTGSTFVIDALTLSSILKYV